jgi:hypothetical protein
MCALATAGNSDRTGTPRSQPSRGAPVSPRFTTIRVCCRVHRGATTLPARCFALRLQCLSIVNRSGEGKYQSLAYYN